MARGLRGRRVRRCAPPPYPRMGYDEAMLRFGSDRPDTRFGLEIADLVEALARLGVQGLRVRARTAAASCAALNAGRARAAALRARRADRAGQGVRRQGAGLGVGRGGRQLALADRQVPRPSEIARDHRARWTAAPGDLLLSSPTSAQVAAEALGALRLELGERFGLRGEGRARRAVGRGLPDVRVRRGRASAGTPLHHPFTAPTRRPRRRPGRAALARLRPRASTARSSAAARSASHRADVQQQVFEAARHRRRGGAGALRLPARRAALRRAAARRDRVRPRPHRRAAGRPRHDPRRDRLPQDGERRATR